MKVAFIVNQFPAFSETFILNQIINLISMGVKVDIYARSKDEKAVHKGFYDFGLDSCVKYFSMPANPYKRISMVLPLLIKYGWRNLSLFKSLNFFKYGREAINLYYFYNGIMYVNSGGYDIIHCHFGPNGVVGAALKEMGCVKGKLIITFHGIDVYRMLNYKPTEKERIVKIISNNVDLVTVNSDYTKKYVNKLLNHKVVIEKLPMGIDISRFEFHEREIKENEIVLITVARLVEKKGIEYSIRAVSRLMEKYSDIKFKYYIIGDGPMKNELTELITRLGCQRNILLLGWKVQQEVIEYYKQAHIFILTSVIAASGDREGQGVVLQEAQAMGLPVVATAHNGFPESVINSQTGFLVPEKDPDAIFQQLCFLVEHPEQWSIIGKKGRQFVESNFDITKLSKQLFDFYTQINKG